jgi:hypothetical protein
MSSMVDVPAIVPEGDSRTGVEVFSAHTSVPTFVEALTGLQHAVREMRPDDVLFEVDACDNRLRVRLRAYRRSSG